jgi:hypothetical protein
VSYLARLRIANVVNGQTQTTAKAAKSALDSLGSGQDSSATENEYARHDGVSGQPDGKETAKHPARYENADSANVASKGTAITARSVYGSFGSSSSSHNAENGAPHWRWRIVFSDGRTIEVRYTPEASRQEVEGHYPGTTVEPLSDADEESAGPLSADEDQLLLDPHDDRRFCTHCANLAAPDRRGPRWCLAAARGKLEDGVKRPYCPTMDIPRRCEAFTPLAGAPDRRTGRELWPSLPAGRKPRRNRG